jgi:hypothetical protein
LHGTLKPEVVTMAVPRASHAHFAVRLALVAVELFIGVGAVYGGTMLIRDSWALPVTDLEPLPLDSWVLPGVALLASVAAPMLSAAILVARRHPHAADLSIAAGAALVGWILFQLAVIGPQMGLQAAMLVLGAGTAALGLLLRRQEPRRSPAGQLSAKR